MTYRHIIGVDPGPVPGLVLLTPRANGRRLDVEVVQCTAGAAPSVLGALLDDFRQNQGRAPALVAIEKFVPGRHSNKAGRASSRTRDVVGQLEREAAYREGVTVVQRPAVAVKPWATDERLEAAGLLAATKGMRHAKDAARHVLFAACHDAGMTDPLSRNYRR